jgi:hypothetical protein
MPVKASFPRIWLPRGWPSRVEAAILRSAWPAVAEDCARIQGLRLPAGTTLTTTPAHRTLDVHSRLETGAGGGDRSVTPAGRKSCTTATPIFTSGTTWPTSCVDLTASGPAMHYGIRALGRLPCRGRPGVRGSGVGVPSHVKRDGAEVSWRSRTRICRSKNTHSLRRHLLDVEPECSENST